MNSLMSILMSASSLPNMNSASALASSVLPTPVGPRKMNEPIGRLGSLRPARARRTALRDDLDRLLLADDPVVEGLLHLEQPLGLLLGDAGDRDAGPHRDDLGDLLLVDRRAASPEMLRLPLGAQRVDALAGGRLAPRAASAASSYSWSLIAASFSLVIRSSSFCASRSSGGADEWRRRTRLAASSIRSIALSGRWRSVM